MLMRRVAWATLLLALGTFGFGFTRPARASTPIDLLARKAVSDNAGEATAAVSELRAMGPKGLQVLLYISDEQSKQGTVDRLLKKAIDAVAQQRDASASRLYWYTDLAEATKAAKETNRPILSLRMLGRLDEELSCANSRFFRMALYANQDISQYLREHYVIHWQSVRPVPKITIDFGDGRKVERTVTGNSIHYLLDRNGRPIDALPGLYSPAAFLQWLKDGAQFEQQLNQTANEPARSKIFQQYHQSQKEIISKNFQTDLTSVGSNWPVEVILNAALARQRKEHPPSAVAAGVKVPTKSIAELPLVRSILPRELTEAKFDEIWQIVATQHPLNAVLDANSVAMIKSKNRAYQTGTPEAAQALNRVVANFQRSMAKDTVYNEYIFHGKLHDWFIEGAAATGVDALNERVYDELFLTPNSDPWLGLIADDTYLGIEDDGISK